MRNLVWVGPGLLNAFCQVVLFIISTQSAKNVNRGVGYAYAFWMRKKNSILTFVATLTAKFRLWPLVYAAHVKLTSNLPIFFTIWSRFWIIPAWNNIRRNGLKFKCRRNHSMHSNLKQGKYLEWNGMESFKSPHFCPQLTWNEAM